MDAHKGFVFPCCLLCATRVSVQDVWPFALGCVGGLLVAIFATLSLNKAVLPGALPSKAQNAYRGC